MFTGGSQGQLTLEGISLKTLHEGIILFGLGFQLTLEGISLKTLHEGIILFGLGFFRVAQLGGGGGGAESARGL